MTKTSGFLMGTLKWNTVPSQRLTSGFLRNRLCHLEDLCHLCDLCHLHGRGSFSFEYMPALTHERKSKRLMLACRKREIPHPRSLCHLWVTLGHPLTGLLSVVLKGVADGGPRSRVTCDPRDETQGPKTQPSLRSTQQLSNG